MKAPTFKLTAAQKRAMLDEIKRQTVDIVHAYETDLDTAWLFAIREEFGFGKDRLERLYRKYFEYREQIQREYQGIEGDGIRETAMRSALKYAGVDVDALYDEFGGRRLTIAYKEDGNG